MCELSIVIVNWNGGDCLVRTLESVHAALDPSWVTEIILVDNASLDASVDHVAERFPDVQILRNTHNIGFGAANNLAFERVRSRFILILNPDTLVDRAALGALLAFMRAHPQAGACGPKIFEADGRTINPWCVRRELYPIDVFFEYAYLYRLLPRQRWFGRYTMGNWDHGEDRQVAALSGACMLIRRTALEQAGGFDEDFFMYGEDIDWCRRVRCQGWQLWFVAGAAMRHLGARSTCQTPDRGTRWAIQSMLLLFRKYGRPADVLKVKLALSLGCLIRSLAWLCAGLIKPRQWRAALQRSQQYLRHSIRTWAY